MFRAAFHRVKRAVIRTTVGGTIVIGTVEWATNLPSQGRSSQFYHSLADEWVTPAFRRLDPETAHHAAILAAKWGLSPVYRGSIKEQRCRVSQKLFSVGLTFPNPVGLAAGFDKDGEVIQPMLNLGFGFVEIGTVTPLAQPGNPKPRMFRLPESLSIINRYGFNSAGANAVERNVWKFRNPKAEPESESESWPHYFRHLVYGSGQAGGILGINVGKNKQSTDAVGDYVSNIKQLSPLADYLVLNISSPNTQGLRDLQQSDVLRQLLEKCIAARDETRKGVPLLVKLAPDLTNDELNSIAKVCMAVQIDGIVVSNTTNQRPEALFGRHRSEKGGLSGQFLRDRSTECIRKLFAETNGSIPIIGVGGIGSGKDAYEKIRAGASLVQVYSMMVYEGPGVVSRIREELATLMLENGQRCIEDVVGIDHEDIMWRRREERLKTIRSRESKFVMEGDKSVFTIKPELPGSLEPSKTD